MSRFLLVFACLALFPSSGFSQDLEAMMKLTKLKSSYGSALKQGDFVLAYDQLVAGRAAEKTLGVAATRSTFDARQLTEFSNFKLAQAKRWLMVEEAKSIALVELMRLQALRTLPAGKESLDLLNAAKENAPQEYQQAQKLFDKGTP